MIRIVAINLFLRHELVFEQFPVSIDGTILVGMLEGFVELCQSHIYGVVVSSFVICDRFSFG